MKRIALAHLMPLHVCDIQLRGDPDSIHMEYEERYLSLATQVLPTGHGHILFAAILSDCRGFCNDLQLRIQHNVRLRLQLHLLNRHRHHFYFLFNNFRGAKLSEYNVLQQ